MATKAGGAAASSTCAAESTTSSGSTRSTCRPTARSGGRLSPAGRYRRRARWPPSSRIWPATRNDQRRDLGRDVRVRLEAFNGNPHDWRRAHQRAASVQPGVPRAGRTRPSRGAIRQPSIARVCDRRPPRVSATPPEGRILTRAADEELAMDRRSRILLARYEGALEDRRALVTGAVRHRQGDRDRLRRRGSGRRAPRPPRAAAPETAELVEKAGARALGPPRGRDGSRALDRAVSRASDELGAASIAVANAGVDARANLQELDPARLRRALATNTEGVANLARSVVPSMREHGGGKLIVVASDNGRRPEAAAAVTSRRSSRPSGSPSPCRSS